MNIARPHRLRSAAFVAVLASITTLGLLAQAPSTPAAPAPAKDDEPRVGIRFEGLLPGSNDPKLEGDFRVEFRIYLSPQGGDAVWREEQQVHVAHGRMDVVLGSTKPVPMQIHEATFKFLGASVGGAREVYPRFTVVNTVYASPEEVARIVSGESPGFEAKPARAGANGLYAASGAAVSEHTEAASTWKQALLAARAAGGDLADYEDWYAALSKCSKASALERAGHYEWVLPWVYDTASHGAYNRLYRGRFQGCDYMDLSPSNAYVYRVAVVPQASARDEGAKK